jgi:hypothetical protein
MDHILSTVAETWRNTPAPLQTIVTAAFGTLIGAWLVSRSQAKRRVVDELRAVHIAHALCFSIINRALALKQQQIRPMKERHDEAVAAFQARQRPLELAIDLETISQIKFPEAALEKIIFEKCTIGARALVSVTALSGAIDDLRNSIDFRNSLISEFREQRNKMTDLDRIQLYVGAPKAGEVDARFVSNVQALSKQTDDCLFFSRLLAAELVQYGNVLRSRYKLRYRLGVSKLSPIDWTKAQEANLIPDEAEFTNWLASFKRPSSRWERFCGWVKGVKAEVVLPETRIAPSQPKPFCTLGRIGYRKRSKSAHSTFLDHGVGAVQDDPRKCIKKADSK